jgi:hypothetical protein
VLQVVSAVESSPEILTQVQDVIIPIVQFTLENKLLGGLLFSFSPVVELMWSSVFQIYSTMHMILSTVSLSNFAASRRRCGQCLN